MNEKALNVLEYNKIIHHLADFAGSQPGKERCHALVPSEDLSEIRRMQRETTDAVSRILRKSRPSFSGLSDIRASLRRLEVGSSLNIEELLRICSVMETAGRIKNWARSDGRKSAIPVDNGGDSDTAADSLEQMFTDLQPLTQ
ncbi:MAG: endonuclease MutS2, partial [Lachnospiraceae bacterium]|nr:endonuclease MutS2 [Lachnospiraceae bacterium]